MDRRRRAIATVVEVIAIYAVLAEAGAAVTVIIGRVEVIHHSMMVLAGVAEGGTAATMEGITAAAQ